MMIARCSWHKFYFGFDRVMNVHTTPDDSPIQFTDGICEPCRNIMLTECRPLTGIRG